MDARSTPLLLIAALSFLYSTAAVADIAASNKKSVLRKLTNYEYKNTIYDLFGVRPKLDDVLPPDDVAVGYESSAEAQGFAAAHIEGYLEAASIVTEEARLLSSQTSATHSFTFKEGISKNGTAPKGYFRYEGESVISFGEGFSPTAIRNFKIPYNGRYRLSIEVGAVQTDSVVPFQIWAGDVITNRLPKRSLGMFDAQPDENTVELVAQFWEGDFIRITPSTGVIRLRERDIESYPGPGLRLRDVVFEGPLAETSRLIDLGLISLVTNLSQAYALLDRWLPYIFRTSPELTDQTVYREAVRTYVDKGGGLEEAIEYAIRLALSSPRFLNIVESVGDDNEIDSYSIVARLSYLLWSSLPDDRLFSLAENMELLELPVLAAEVDRLLSDPKSDRFVEKFTDEWLQLRDIDATQPDVVLYPEWDAFLRWSILEEPRLFFRHMLTNNMSVGNFIESDWLMLNERLAQHYELRTDIRGAEFVVSPNRRKSQRGGFLGQAGPLKITSNGLTTSPVQRGAWVLRNLLGVEIPPPPFSVGSIEPDVTGSNTVYKMLRAHREDPVCAGCHDQLDPVGLQLEIFDVIGGLRTNYRTLGAGFPPTSPVANEYASTKKRYRFGSHVPSKLPFVGRKLGKYSSFRRGIAENPYALADNFAKQLVMYALGRKRGSLKSIIAKRRSIPAGAGSPTYRLRDLVVETVASDAFKTR